eukprot:987702-Prorocentrum_minimum.AAC.1
MDGVAEELKEEHTTRPRFKIQEKLMGMAAAGNWRSVAKDIITYNKVRASTMHHMLEAKNMALKKKVMTAWKIVCIGTRPTRSTPVAHLFA